MSKGKAVWVDSNGVAHTVALPQPDDYVDPGFLAELRLGRAEVEYELRDRLEDRAIAEFKAAKRHRGPKVARAGTPEDLLIGRGCAGDPIRTAVGNAIAQLPVQWRLDALLVLGELLDQWDDDQRQARD